MLKISEAYAGCPDLSPATSAQFTLEMCATTENCKKTLKSRVVQNSRSLKVIAVDTIKSSSLVLVMIIQYNTIQYNGKFALKN